ncbi:sulfatase-like hydrolase/transferase [Haloferula sp.]|uniref:sulfatase-like hydrolase/transferase n=1 Tax=Haloferula sp. TaxID=2497595 RepID=UPI00329DEACD
MTFARTPTLAFSLFGLAMPAIAATTHHYRLDETFQHETIADSVGSIDASSTTLVRGLEGVIAGAFDFREGDLDSIDFGPSNAVLPSDDFTVTLWVKASSDGFDENERLLDCSNGDSFAQMSSGFNFKQQGGTLRVFVGDGTNKATTSSSDSTLTTEAWYLVAYRFTASSNPGTANDGLSQVTAIPLGIENLSAGAIAGLTDSAAHDVGSPASSTKLVAGTRPTGTPNADLSFDGLMDDIRIHDSALTDQELADLHNENVHINSSLRWIFNIDGDQEGWTGSGLSSLAVSGGNLVATSGGIDPWVQSPDNLGLDLTGISRVFIKARNNSPLTSATVFFQTTSNPSYAGNSKGFSVIASDPGFTTYEVDMSTHSNWNGTLKRLRIDIPNGESTGMQILFDRIAVGESGNRPNVIVMMADDLGWRDVTTNGSVFYETPNVERLAASGMNFPNAYAANPLCSPTRAGVLTGLYPARVRFNTPSGHVGNVELDPGVGTSGDSYLPSTSVGTRTRLPNGYVTYGELLNQVGYSTAFLGKWHLGKDEYVPDNQGFDLVVGGRQHPGPPNSFFAPFAADSNIPATWPDGSPIVTGDHVNDVLAAYAAEFISDNRHQPFLINMWWYDVHAPFEAKTAIRDKYTAKKTTSPDPEGRQDSQTMAAMIEVMDDGIGTIIDKLEELGLRDDTVVFFTSDNGGWMYSWIDEDLAVPTDNYPSRAGKACIWDGGTRVPFIVNWPGEISEGSTNDDLVNNLDIYTTILEMTGVDPYDGYPLDSLSLVPSLKGQAPTNNDIIYNQFPQSPPATGTFPGVWVRQGNMKLIRFFHGNGAVDDHRYELYDMTVDPGEENNLAADNMGPGGLVETMDALITQHLIDTDSLVPNYNTSYVPPSFDGWTPNFGVWVQDGENWAIKMVSNSFLPAIDSPDLSALPAPAKVRVIMTSRSYGDGRIWWKFNPSDDWTMPNSTSFPVTHDNTKRTIEIPITPGAPVAGIRFQPSAGYYQSEVVSIEILDASDNVIEVMTLIDSDGDGKTDAEEGPLHRDPNDARDLAFEFNSDGDSEGWSPSNTASFLVDSGTMSGLSTSGDPQIQNAGFSFDADRVPNLYVKLRADGNADMQFFWGRDGADAIAAARRLDIPYTGSGDWQYIQIPVSTSPLAGEWNNRTITQLRIDPIFLNATTWEIDWIRGTNGDHDGDGLSDASEGFPDRDTDGDGIEDWADTDSDNDGAPDFAEDAAGRDPYSAIESGLNADGDPYTDLFEMIAGTDPDSFSDQFGLVFSAVPQASDRLVTLTFNGKGDRDYRLLRSFDLSNGSWVAVDSHSSATDDSVSLTDTLSNDSAFYSVEVIWPY